MKFIETNIEGVIIVEPRVFADDRGYFFESYNESSFQAAGIPNRFIQDNQSKSSYGVIRGLHCQNNEFAQAKLVRVLHGKILDVAVDIREGSPTFGKHVKDVVTQNQADIVLITNKISTQRKGLGNPLRRVLHDILQVQPQMLARTQQLLNVWRILWGGNNQNVADVELHQRRQRIIDHWLVVNRQKLFGGCACQGVKARTAATCKNNTLHDLRPSFDRIKNL